MSSLPSHQTPRPTSVTTPPPHEVRYLSQPVKTLLCLMGLPVAATIAFSVTQPSSGKPIETPRTDEPPTARPAQLPRAPEQSEPQRPPLPSLASHQLLKSLRLRAPTRSRRPSTKSAPPIRLS